MFKKIKKLFQNFSKKNTLSLQEAVDLKNQLYDEIKSIENKIRNFTSDDKKSLSTNNVKTNMFELLATLLNTLNDKETEYSKLSLNILKANLVNGNNENIKLREILVRRRAILQTLPDDIRIPGKIFVWEKSGKSLPLVLKSLDKQILTINKNLETINKKVRIKK